MNDSIETIERTQRNSGHRNSTNLERTWASSTFEACKAAQRAGKRRLERELADTKVTLDTKQADATGQADTGSTQ